MRSALFRAEPAHQVDYQADQEDQAHAPAADGRTPEIEAATAEQEKENHEQKH